MICADECRLTANESENQIPLASWQGLSGIGKTACAVWEAGPERYVQGSARQGWHAGARWRLPREKPAEKSAGKNNQLRTATRIWAPPIPCTSKKF
jgi:hypothetical protein